MRWNGRKISAGCFQPQLEQSGKFLDESHEYSENIKNFRHKNTPEVYDETGIQSLSCFDLAWHFLNTRHLKLMYKAINESITLAIVIFYSLYGQTYGRGTYTSLNSIALDDVFVVVLITVG